MKKRLLALALLTITFFCFSFMACLVDKEEGNKVVPDIPEVSTVQMLLSKANVTLEKREEIVLTATVEDMAVNGVSWKSSNESVATVSNGTVVAVAEGSAVIIATYNDLEARCPVTVTDHHLIPGITTNVTSETLYLLSGDYFDLTYFVTYNNKKVDDASVNVTLICEDQSVVFENDKITAKKISEKPVVVMLSGTWRGMEFNSTFEVMVVGNLTAKLADSLSINLYNDANGGDVECQFTPKFMMDDKVIDESDFAITEWEYDEKIIEIDEEAKTVKGLSKGTTKVVATFKSNATGATVKTEITINVDLYTYDKSETVLDTLYLNQDKFLLISRDIYSDLSEDDLKGWGINAIEDVTDTTHYPIAVSETLSNGNAIVDISAVKALGVTGERKWKIDCDKYSYIVTVPVEERHLAKDLAGTYTSNDWDISVKISFVDNKDKIEFFYADGSLVETGTFTVAEWQSPNSGTLEITTFGFELCDTKIIRCFYYTSNGACQLNLFLDGAYGNPEKYFVVYNGEQALPSQNLAGEYKCDDFYGYSLILEENAVCSFKSAILGQVNGTYAVSGNKITITLESAINNQTVFEGTVAGNKITLVVENDFDKTFKKDSAEGETISPEDQKYCGIYRANDRPWIKLDVDGTFVFAFPYYNTSISSTGTYTLNDGEIVVNITSGWYKGTHTGTYYEKDGKMIIEIKIVYDSVYENVK